MGKNKYDLKKTPKKQHKDLFRQQRPLIWQQDWHSWETHTSVRSLAQQPCSMYFEINNRLLHHRLRFTAQSITSVVVTCAACINHLAYSVKVNKRLLLIKWTSRSKCKWPIVKRVAGWFNFQLKVFVVWLDQGAFIWPQSSLTKCCQK